MSRLFFLTPPPSVAGETVDQLQSYSNINESHHRISSSSSSSTAIIIVVIVIASAILFSASLYLLIRFITRRFHRSARTFSASDTAGNLETSTKSPPEEELLFSLPLFTFGSVNKKPETGDCAVCLSKFEPNDQLRLLPLCCHAFHAECIDTWLVSNQTCPLCRSTVNPNEDDVQRKIHAPPVTGEERSNSFRIEIGSVSRRQLNLESGEARRSYSIGSFEYIVDDGYEVSVESIHHRGLSDCSSVDKDSTGVPVSQPMPGGESLEEENTGGSQSWLRDYVDRLSSISSHSFRSSGRFFTGSGRRSDAVAPEDIERNDVGEEISELFRWFSAV